MTIYWLYELPSSNIEEEGKGSGIFQGCSGPDAEKVIHQVATEPGDGKPFKVVDVESYEAMQQWLKAAEHLLEEVRSCYSRDDDLPDNLLPRIDEWLGD